MVSRSCRFLGVCLSLAVLVGPAPGQGLNEEQQTCQQLAAKEGLKLFKSVFKSLAKCEDALSKGALPQSTDCLLEATTAAKIAAAENKLTATITGGKCPDSVVGTLPFAGDCSGVATAAALASCLIDTHEAAATDLIDLIYAGSGLLDADGTKCQKTLAKKVTGVANKRLAGLQKCKNGIGNGSLPPSTDCLADVEFRTKIETAAAKAVEKAGAACTTAATAALDLGAPCGGNGNGGGAAACLLCKANDKVDELLRVEFGTGPSGMPITGTASAVQITDPNDCVGGPLSRCRIGDYLLANDRIRVVVQGIQRNLFGVGQFGGQIIDADLVRDPNEPDRDSFEEWSTSLNIEGTAHYTSLAIINDGSDGKPAVLRATGVDDLLDYLNPSSIVAGFGYKFPSSADDVDLPVTIVTDYILEPDTNYVRVDTTVTNTGPSQLKIFFGDFLNGSGQVELFQPAYGFGEAMITGSCPATAANPCNFVAYSGEDEAAGVSYGYVHLVPGTTTFTTSGVTVTQLQTEVLAALVGSAQPPYVFAPNGEPGDSITFTRFFVVGNGNVSAITDARNEIGCIGTGTLRGTVTQNGSPVEGADIAVLGNPSEGPIYITRNVVTHARTDASGQYSLTLPPGDYHVVANLDGSPFEGGGSSPVEHPVTIGLLQETVQDISLPNTGALRVLVADPNSAPLPAKVSVVGFDPSPDPLNTQNNIFLVNTTAVFGERFEDGVPFGVARSIFIDAGGDSGVIPLEPASYRVVVSRGPEYSIYEADVTITAGATETVTAVLYRVVDSTGFVATDNHVHSIDSVDAEVTRAERVISMLAEGVEYFSATDHEFLSDFSETIEDLGVSNLITSAPGEEITTFDYGHFNAWPISIDPNQVNGGAVDHGGEAPPGMDFPSQGYYSVPPADIIAAGHAKAAPDWTSNTVQVNHMATHFGLDDGSGLAIDTGVSPPVSGAPAAAHRLDPADADPETGFFSETFNALEVWIADNRNQIYKYFLGQNAGDWFNLLNQGITRTGVADSDTHKRTITQSGIPRTMVGSHTDDPGAIDPEEVSNQVNAGRAIGTNAPMVRVTAHASSTGESAALDIGRCTRAGVDCTNTTDCPPCIDNATCEALLGSGAECTALPTRICSTDGAVDVTVDVQSPKWAEFDRIEFYYNTTTTRTIWHNMETGAGKIDVRRYTITPDAVHTAGTDFTVNEIDLDGDWVNTTTDRRWEARTVLSLTGMTEDLWVVALVKGTDGVSKPLFPVVPNDLSKTTNTTLADLIDGNLGESGITALAFTNPLFIEMDPACDGWTAPGLKVNTP